MAQHQQVLLLLQVQQAMPTTHDKSTTWKQIWENKGHATISSKDGSKEPPLHHYAGLNQMSTPQYELYIRTMFDSVVWDDNKFPPQAKVLEFGCGPGALLHTLHSTILPEKQLQIYGIDYSESLIQVARRRVPQGHFWTHDIRRRVPEDWFLAQSATTAGTTLFDVTVSNGVFLYMDHLQDAYQILSEMARWTKPGGMVIVSDINDAAKVEQAKEIRASSRYYQSDAYQKWRKADPGHLYIPKSFFTESAAALGLRIDRIVEESEMDHLVDFYEAARFRYSVFMTKL
eukprot:scaffold5092_cov179-Amphora_coffeaeformis.AAC.7